MSVLSCAGFLLHKFQSSAQLGMQNEICFSSVIYLYMRASQRDRDGREKENLWTLKLSLVKCQDCGLFVACGRIYAPWCHPTAVCLGGSTHTPTHRPSYSCRLQPLTVPPLHSAFKSIVKLLIDISIFHLSAELSICPLPEREIWLSHSLLQVSLTCSHVALTFFRALSALCLSLSC